MPCYFPLRAYKTSLGEVVFVERSCYDIVSQLSLPCGQCIGCRLERSRQWAMRCMHEATLYESNCFVTLTYDDEHMPVRAQLDYPAFQRFMKRLRKFFEPSKARFYMCGEYGPLNFRPHFHACIFGVDFADKVYWSTGESGERIYTSVNLSALWPFGFSSIGSLTFKSAAYCARYCCEKVTGFNAQSYYACSDSDGDYGIIPEFNRMSLKPGIGRRWYDKWVKDVYPHDFVIVNGVRCKPPKYYDKLFDAQEPAAFEELKFKRELEGRSRFLDNTPERLAVKAVVKRAACSKLVRSL